MHITRGTSQTAHANFAEADKVAASLIGTDAIIVRGISSLPRIELDSDGDYECFSDEGTSVFVYGDITDEMLLAVMLDRAGRSKDPKVDAVARYLIDHDAYEGNARDSQIQYTAAGIIAALAAVNEK